MGLTVVETVTHAGSATNEDRAGSKQNFAWIIDGATDVLEEPLTSAPSDAAWFAHALHQVLLSIADTFIGPLDALPHTLSETLAAELASAAKRRPISNAEHPSAAAIIVRAHPGYLDYVALGDCLLIAHTPQGCVSTLGPETEKAGDAWVRRAIEAQRKAQPGSNAPPDRALLWPKLRTARSRMNLPGGYGIFSITSPPRAFIKAGTLATPPGTQLLLATDGMARLIDVFGIHTEHSFFAAAWANGLGALLAAVRAAEQADANCMKFPRAKTSDDATAMLLQLT